MTADPADIDANPGTARSGDGPDRAATTGSTPPQEPGGPSAGNRVPDYAENFEHALRRLTIEKAELKARRT